MSAWLAVCCAVSFLFARDAAPPDLAAWLPRDAVVAIESRAPADALRTLIEGEAGRRLHAAPMLSSLPPAESLRTWVALLARVTDRDVVGFLDDLAGGGAALSVSPGAPGDDDDQRTLLLLRANDADRVQQGVAALLRLAFQADAQPRGTDWELPLGEDGGVAFRRGTIFGVASHPELLSVAASGEGSSLADDPDFAAAREALGDTDLLAWARGVLLAELPERLDNAGASLFAGGPAEALRRASWVALGAELDAHTIALRLLAPADRDALVEDHAPFFPPAAEIDVPQLADPLATLVLHKDLGPWWDRRDLYLTEAGHAATLEGDGGLSTILQRDLGPEFLAHLRPEAVLLVARTTFPDGAPAPEFPAAVLGFTPRADAPDDLSQALVNAFFVTTTIVNFESGGVTRPMLQPDMEVLPDGARLYSAQWSQVDHDAPLPARFNLTPALLVTADERLWLSSSETLLRRVAEAPTEPVAVDGDRLALHLAHGRELLAANREEIVTRRALEEGGDIQVAGIFADLLDEAAALFDALEVSAGLRAGAGTHASAGTDAWLEVILEARCR